MFTKRLRSGTASIASIPIPFPLIPGTSPTTVGLDMSFMSRIKVGCRAMLLPTYKQSRMAVMPPFCPRGMLNLESVSGLCATTWKLFIPPPAGILSTAVRGCTPLYPGAAWLHADTTSNARGSNAPQRERANGLPMSPPSLLAGHPAGPRLRAPLCSPRSR